MKAKEYRLGMPCLLINDRGTMEIKPLLAFATGDNETNLNKFGVVSANMWASGQDFHKFLEIAKDKAQARANHENTTAKDKAIAEELINEYENRQDQVYDELQAAAASCKPQDHFPLGSRLWYIDDVPKGRILTGIVSEIAYHTSSLSPYQEQWGKFQYKFAPSPEAHKKHQLYNTAHTDNFFVSEEAARAELRTRFNALTAGVLLERKVQVFEAQQHYG